MVRSLLHFGKQHGFWTTMHQNWVTREQSTEEIGKLGREAGYQSQIIRIVSCCRILAIGKWLLLNVLIWSILNPLGYSYTRLDFSVGLSETTRHFKCWYMSQITQCCVMVAIYLALRPRSRWLCTMSRRGSETRLGDTSKLSSTRRKPQLYQSLFCIATARQISGM